MTINQKQLTKLIRELNRKHLRKIDIAREVAFKLLTTKSFITVDDIRKLMKLKPGKNMWLGAVFRDERFSKVGTEATTIKTSHYRPVGLWTLKWRYSSDN